MKVNKTASSGGSGIMVLQSQTYCSEKAGLELRAQGCCRVRGPHTEQSLSSQRQRRLGKAGKNSRLLRLKQCIYFLIAVTKIPARNEQEDMVGGLLLSVTPF